MRIVPLIIAILFIASSIAVADSFSVTLKVVDETGTPIAGAQASAYWRSEDGTMKPIGDSRAVTDAVGTATLRVDDWNEKRPILVLHAERKLGAVVGVNRDDDGRELVVVLGPTVTVKGKLDSPELGHSPTWSNTTVAPDGFRAHCVDHISQSGEFQFVLPAGKFVLRTNGTDVVDSHDSISVSPDHPLLDLGTVEMGATIIAKMKGKPAPAWSVDTAPGAPVDATLASFKGKWVYLEFWGYW